MSDVLVFVSFQTVDGTRINWHEMYEYNQFQMYMQEKLMYQVSVNADKYSKVHA